MKEALQWWPQYKGTQGSGKNEQEDVSKERMHVVFMATGNNVSKRNNHEHVNMFNVTVVIQFSAVEDRQWRSLYCHCESYYSAAI